MRAESYVINNMHEKKWINILKSKKYMHWTCHKYIQDKSY